MLNSIQNSVKYLRWINIKTTLRGVTPKRVPNIIANLPKEKNELSATHKLLFSPRTVGLEITEKPQISRVKQDPIPYVPILNPRSILPLVEDWGKGEIGLPSLKQEEIQAARLIVIRRKKMKKHQRRKLWKRMRHRWARVKQHRRQIKEKKFQNELLALVQNANEFSAEKYVAEKIQKANYTPIPTRWRHKRLPEFIIRQLLGIDKKINYKHTDTYKA